MAFNSLRTKPESLMITLTAALNKISGENQDRVILMACEDVMVESYNDARLIVGMLYHRAVHDGCFFSNYARLLKALRQTYPEVFQGVQFPSDWASFQQLVDCLAEQEDANFLANIDEKQRQRLVAVAIIRFFGHLFINNLWDPQKLISELWQCDSKGHPLKATCRKGMSLYQLLVPFDNPYCAKLELYVECTCALLQVIRSDGLDVLDSSGCFKHKVLAYLTYLLHQQQPGGQTLLGTRIRFLVEDILKQDWARACPYVFNGSRMVKPEGQPCQFEVEEMEQRTDPRDGKAYTLHEFLRHYRSSYTEREIKLYFAFECMPIDAKQKRRHQLARKRHNGQVGRHRRR